MLRLQAGFVVIRSLFFVFCRKNEHRLCRFFKISDSIKFSKIEKKQKFYTKPCFFYTKKNKPCILKNKTNNDLTIIYFTNIFVLENQKVQL